MSDDFVSMLRASIRKLRVETMTMEPMAAATSLAWIEMMEGLIDVYSPKTTHRIAEGHAAPPGDMATGDAGSDPGV